MVTTWNTLASNEELVGGAFTDVDLVIQPVKQTNRQRSTFMNSVAVLAFYALLAGGTLAAAQSTTDPTSGSATSTSQNVSPETYCKDASGQAKLKDTASGAGTTVPSAPGSGVSQTGTAAQSTSGSTPGIGPSSTSGSTATSPANLPNC
jgi:hypothetical protein